MIGSWIVTTISATLFLLFQAKGIYTGDSGDLVTAAAVLGVPHPPGYPLYTWLGWIASRLPLFSISWRLTLLSSLPHAITAGLVYAIIYRATKGNILASVFGAAVLISNYLFFLYSITPEVFALFDVFVVLLWFLLFEWQTKHRKSLLYGAGFVFGLSLSHHHVMLFFVPAIIYFLWENMKPAHKHAPTYRDALVCCAWFAVGFLPYVYIPLAAKGDPIINWDRVVSLGAFWRLISRADYGTFVSGGSFGQTLHERWLAVAAYGTFILTDWTRIGVFFGGIGLLSLWQSFRTRFWTFIIAILFCGPVFVFYASFPLASRFTLGTYERFLLPGYVLFAILCGLGLAYCLTMVKHVAGRYLGGKKRHLVAYLIGFVFMIYPLAMGSVTVWRFWGMPDDRTAENLGRDMLLNASTNGILLLSQDTTLFTTQYVRYVLGVRTDTAVIHAARLSLPDYQIVLKKHFPRLVLPDVPQREFLSAFVKANTSATQRIYSNINLPVADGWYWVPRGLLYEAMSYQELPTANDMYARATEIASAMHNPRIGILSRYSHLMLSDVLDVYANGYIALGKTLVRADKWEEARGEFAKAVAIDGDTSIVEALELLGVTQVYLKDCTGALHSFEDAKNRSFVATPRHLRLESVTYAECVGDPKRARELYSEYERLRQSSEQSLESL